MTKSLKYLAAVGLAAGLAQSAWAQPDGQTNYQWTAAGDAHTWSQGANWTSTWADNTVSPSVSHPGIIGLVPPTDGTTYAVDTTASAGGSKGPINIAATDLMAINDSMFGPDWGQTMNVSGTVRCGWGMFIWGDDISGLTTLNVNPGGSVTVKDTIALGTAWWFSPGAKVLINVYTNAFLGVAWFQFGGKISVYNGGVVSVTNGWNTGTATGPVFTSPAGQDTDATRAINIEKGAMLVLPASYTATVTDWITRGILQTYGAPAAAADIVIDEANVDWPGRTVVTTTATTPSIMTAVYVQVPRTNLYVGGLEQAQVFADYTAATNVNVTLTATNIIYQSGNTNVATITAAGQVRATGLGTTTLKAIVGVFSNTVSVTVAAYTNTATLLHRYNFAETDGTTATDLIAGPDWNGTLVNAGATFSGTGQLVLDGLDGYVSFPSGMLLNLDAVTIETWVTFGTISNWAVLFTFGDITGTAGFDYLSCQPHTGGATAQTGIRNTSTEQNPFFTPVLDNYTNLHLVAVFHPQAGFLSIYTNGMLAAINNSITIPLSEAFASGDPYNYIGHSLWSNDPNLPVIMDEFRIYSGPLTPGQIKADAALGPNQFIGSTTNIALAAVASGGSLVIKWPTTSALVSLLSSPVLGPGAVWTQVAAVPKVVSGNYQVTIPPSGTAMFFRLQQ